MNQLFSSSHSTDGKIPEGIDIEDNYLTIDDVFNTSTSFNFIPIFVTDRKECDRTRSKVEQRDEFEKHQKADERIKYSLFSDANGNEIYSSHLKSETDRLALAFKECHLVKILKYCHAHWVGDAILKRDNVQLSSGRSEI